MRRKVVPSEMIFKKQVQELNHGTNSTNVLEEVEEDINRIQELANRDVSNIIDSVNRSMKGHKASDNSSSKPRRNSLDIDDDVKLSYEIARDNRNHDLQTQLAEAKKRMNEYKKRYLLAVEKAKDVDIKYSEVELKKELLEEENANLKRDLGARRGPDRRNGSSSTPFLMKNQR